MRRRQTRVPNTVQRSLGFGEVGQRPSPGKRGTKVRVGATAFRDATPWDLHVGPERLDAYLTSRGLGWVVKLREELQQVDCSALELNYQGSGRPPYHPRMMIGLIVYGVLKSKSSLRELEELAVADVGAWWVCAGQQPDHSTIGDFLVRHQPQLTGDYFTQLVRDLAGRKAIHVGVVAGDGTVIEASASRFELLTREAAERAAQQATAAAAAHPSDPALAAHAQAAEAVAARAADRVELQQRKGATAAERTPVVTPVEPEAVAQRCKDGRYRPAYKPSVLVHESGLIVAQVVEPSSEAAAVAALFNQHEAIFDAPPATVLLDAGYHNLKVLSEAVERGIDVLCPSGNMLDDRWQRRGNRGQFGKTQFTYDAEHDRYHCPAGHWLTPGQRYRHTNTGQAARNYRTRQCRQCPLRSQCTQSKTGRVLTRHEGDEIKEAMEQVMTQPRARQVYRLRREIVERVFAELGWRQGLRRFRRRGRAGAALEFSVHCIAHNLKWAVHHDLRRIVITAVRYFGRLWRLIATQRPGSTLVTAESFQDDLLLPKAA